MACARCDFYIPKPSTAAQLLEANTNLTRMLVEIPLTDDERAAVEDDSATRTPRRHTHPGRAHATHPREPRPPSRHHDADHQPRQRPAAMPAREPLRQRLSPESACYL